MKIKQGCVVCYYLQQVVCLSKIIPKIKAFSWRKEKICDNAFYCVIQSFSLILEKEREEFTQTRRNCNPSDYLKDLELLHLFDLSIYLLQESFVSLF